MAHSFHKACTEHLLWDNCILGIRSIAVGKEGLCWKGAYLPASELGSEGHHSHVTVPPSHPLQPGVEGEQELGGSNVLTVCLGHSFQAALNIEGNHFLQLPGAHHWDSKSISECCPVVPHAVHGAVPRKGGSGVIQEGNFSTTYFGTCAPFHYVFTGS